MLLDNAPSHPSSETLQSDDGMIKTMFLPPNTTAAIQPMDQGVLDPCKQRYKKKLLSHIILENESADKSVPDILKGITIKSVVHWIAAAWEEASAESLQKAWNKLLPEVRADISDGVSATVLSLDLVKAVAQLGNDSAETITQWMEEDMEDPGHQILDYEEVVASMMETQNEVEESPDEETADVNAREVCNALEVTLQ